MPSPEPKGVKPMFGQDSWKRPETASKTTHSTDPAAKVSRASFLTFLGPARVQQWTALCDQHELKFPDLMKTAGEAANIPFLHDPSGRHYDARSHLRTLISDGIRAYLIRAGKPDATVPVFY